MNSVGVEAAAAAASSDVRLETAFRHWNALLEALPAGVYVCDAEARITHYNRRAAELWGRAPAPGEARYSGALRLFGPDGAAMPMETSPMSEVLRTGVAARDRQVIFERPDGRRIDILANIAPLLDGCGVVVGAVSCFQDVTEVKRGQ